MNKYVIGRATFDNHGFRDGTLYYMRIPVNVWSEKLSDARIFENKLRAEHTLEILKDQGLVHPDSVVWEIDSKRIFEARLKG